MRLLLDTNIILDYLSVNEGFQEDAEAIISLAVEGEAIELVSASAVTDIYYMLRRALKDKQKAMARLIDLRKLIHILPVTEKDIDTAMERNWGDFEDAVQYTVAESNQVDYIITRDAKGFEEHNIPSLTPKDFLKMIGDII